MTPSFKIGDYVILNDISSLYLIEDIKNGDYHCKETNKPDATLFGLEIQHHLRLATPEEISQFIRVDRGPSQNLPEYSEWIGKYAKCAVTSEIRYTKVFKIENVYTDGYERFFNMKCVFNIGGFGTKVGEYNQFKIEDILLNKDIRFNTTFITWEEFEVLKSEAL